MGSTRLEVASAKSPGGDYDREQIEPTFVTCGIVPWRGCNRDHADERSNCPVCHGRPSRHPCPTTFKYVEANRSPGQCRDHLRCCGCPWKAGTCRQRQLFRRTG